MPKNIIDYSNTIIYKIFCKDKTIDHIYIGHTTNFIKKKHIHKKNCNNEKSSNDNFNLYKIIRENGGWDNWDMSIIEKCNLKNGVEARTIEEKYYKLIKNEYNNNSSSIENLSNTFKENLLENSLNKYECRCGKIYKHSQSLYKHKQNCNKNNIINVDDSKNLFEILKQNQEFKDLILEQNKIIMELAKNAGNNNNNINNINSNNKTFNLQVFLNEKCKDALNISDFVNSLKLTLEDLENVGEKGFVDGISRIFVNGLKQLDVYKRPIHCSDLKRETMYLKNENVWEKDNDNKENMKKVIKQIANKNIKNIYEWKDKYPDCKYSDSKKNDQYSRIIIESMGARTIEEDQILYEKIIKNIAKETVIYKTK